MHIALGTTSKDKKKIAEKVLDDLNIKATIETFSVDSGVSDQPLSEEETIRGAGNRAKEALKKESRVEMGLGMEGGLSKIDNLWYLVCAVVLVDRLGKKYLGISEKLALPKEVSLKINRGAQFGQVIRQTEPTPLVRQLITREKSFTQAMKRACLAFLSRQS